ncbi:MauE/DoxX family redox-associated membrane protein [Verrucomicrobiota bacterium]
MKMRDLTLPPWIPLFSAVTVGLLFLLASLNKVLHPADFALSIFRYHVVPHSLVNFSALILSWLELVCAVCVLFVPKMRKAALWILLILLVVFTGAIVVNILRGLHVACGCFNTSPLAKPLSWINVLRNSGIILFAVLALIPEKIKPA